MLPTAATVRNGSAKASSAVIPKPQVSIETITKGDTETGEESGIGSDGVVWGQASEQSADRATLPAPRGMGVRCEMDGSTQQRAAAGRHVQYPVNATRASPNRIRPARRHTSNTRR